MWNLKSRAGRGVGFGFMERVWPGPAPEGSFLPLLPYALPFIVLASAMLLAFLLE